jgi:hypothetical protein
MPETLTFYVIRAKKNSPQYRGQKYSHEDVYEFAKGWYASREFVKPFKNVKIFSTEGKAKQYMKNSRTLGIFLDREEYFEIVPIIVKEPE